MCAASALRPRPYPRGGDAGPGKEAVSREPDYLQHCFVMSRSCDPRWGGSAAGLTDFVIRAVAAFEPVKADALYLRIYWWASDLRYFRVLADSGVDCTRLIRGARIVVREYPDPWNFNHVAVLAGECGDQQAAREFVALIGDRPLPEVWGPGSRGEQNFRRLKDWTAR